MSTVTLYPVATEAEPSVTLLTNSANVKALDGATATGVFPQVGGPPDTTPRGVRGYNFDVDSNVPSGATINSVTLNYTYQVQNGGVTGSSGVTYTITPYVWNGSSFAAQTQVNSPSPRGSDTYSSLTTESSAISKSSGSWTRADLLDASFKVGFRFNYAGGGFNTMTFGVDAISITIDYTASADIEGDAVLDGVATTNITTSLFIGGTATVDGVATTNLVKTQNVFGVAAVGGVATTSINAIVSAAGTAVISGVAADARYAATVLADSPVLFARFNESSGATSFADSAGSHTGTAFGTVTSGGTGLPTNDASNGISVAGGSGVTFGNASDLQVTTGSLEIWFKTNGAGSSYRGLITKQNAYGLYLKDNVLVYYDWTIGESNTGVNLADDKWHHVVMTFQSGVASGTAVYVDGVEVYRGILTVSAQTVGLAVGEGSDHAGESQGFFGRLDEAAFYNAALTPAQVRTHWIAGSDQIKSTVTVPGVATEAGVATTSITATGTTYGSANLDGAAITLVDQPYRDQIISTGPVAYWRLGETSGTTAADQMGVAPGTYASSGITLGAAGALTGDTDTAATFSTDNSYVTASHSTAFDFTTNLTMECWFKGTDSSGNKYIIGSLNWWKLYIYLGNIGFGIDNVSFGVMQYYGDGVGVFDGNWHHIVGVAESGKAKLYVDGVLVAEVTDGSTAHNTSGFLIGGPAAPGGSIDEAAFYSRPLTAAEVRTHYNAGLANGSTVVVVSGTTSVDGVAVTNIPDNPIVLASIALDGIATTTITAGTEMLGDATIVGVATTILTATGTVYGATALGGVATTDLVATGTVYGDTSLAAVATTNVVHAVNVMGVATLDEVSITSIAFRVLHPLISSVGGRITVKYGVTSDFGGTINVRFRVDQDLPGTIKVQYRVTSTLLGSITTTQPLRLNADVKGTISILKSTFKTLGGTIRVRQPLTADVPGRVKVVVVAQPSDLRGSVFVRPVFNLPGRIYVVPSYPLNGFIHVSYPTRTFEDVRATITVRWNQGSSDLPATVSIRHRVNSFLTGNIFVSAFLLPGTITVKQKAPASTLGGRILILPDTPGLVGNLRANVPNAQWQANPSVAFLWDAAPPARTAVVGYQWAISSSPDAATVATWSQTSLLSVSHNFSGQTGIWYFHVRAVNEIGKTGGVSTYVVQYNNQPTRPGVTQMTVNDVSTINNTPLIPSSTLPRLQWSGSTDPDSGDVLKYTIQFASSSDFSSGSLLTILENLSVTTLNLAFKLNSGLTFWRIASSDGKQSSEWSPVGAFRVNSPPTKPTGMNVFDV